MPVALGEHRRLEVDGCEGTRIAQRLRELECALDILARSFVVALTPVAPRPPREHVQLQLVGRKPGPLGERQRLVEQRDRGRDARKLVAADAEAIQHVRAIDIGERLALDQSARLGEQRERGLHIARLRMRHRLAVQRAHPKLGRAGPEDGRQRPRVLRDRLRRTCAPPRERRRGPGSPPPSPARPPRRRSPGSRHRRPGAGPATRPCRSSAASSRARSARCTPSRTGRRRDRSGSTRPRHEAGADVRRAAGSAGRQSSGSSSLRREYAFLLSSMPNT